MFLWPFASYPLTSKVLRRIDEEEQRDEEKMKQWRNIMRCNTALLCSALRVVFKSGLEMQRRPPRREVVHAFGWHGSAGTPAGPTAQTIRISWAAAATARSEWNGRSSILGLYSSCCDAMIMENTVETCAWVCAEEEKEGRTSLWE